ncbi:MAG: 5'-3' exonuclease H3TH domain-containing protein, partial [Flavobacteriales bacterium]
MKNIVLVDGSSYLFRAYHAMPYLTNKQGEPTGAILGVLNMLKKLPTKYNTKHVAVIFDAKGKSFRNDIYPEYKVNRKSIDDELRVQIKPLHDIIKKMGFPLIVVDGVEADDVIGTLAKDLEKEDCRVVISTGDKDMAQLVNEKVVLFDSMKNVTADVYGVVEKYGVRPDQIIDYLALMGDSSDNIPGVPSVGPKTAVKWLAEYENMEGVITNQDKIKGKVGEKLRDNIEQLRLSYTLATIKCDLELGLSLDDLKCKKSDNEYLAERFTHYGFNALLKGLGVVASAPDYALTSVAMENTSASLEVVHPTQKVEVDYKTIFTIEELKELVAELNDVKNFAFDTETDSLDTREANLVGLSFCTKE